MIKKIILSLTVLLGIASARAVTDGDWKIYPSFDNSVSQIVATPNKVYMLGAGHPKLNPSEDKYNSFSDILSCLYEYDMETDELTALTNRDKLSDVRIKTIAYNPDRKYLVVVYLNGNIDLLFDDGRVRNIQGLKLLTIIQNKDVNGITFSPENKEAYIATSFGYVVIDDENCVIKTSRVLGVSVNSAARVSNTIFLATGSHVYRAAANAPTLSINDFAVIDNAEIAETTELLPLTPTKIGFYVEPQGIWTMEVDAADPTAASTATKVFNAAGSGMKNFQRVPGGYFYDINWAIGIFYNDGSSYDAMIYPNVSTSYSRSTSDMKTIWEATGRKGIRQREIVKDTDNAKWNVLKDYMFPNVPTSGLSSGGNIAYNPGYGMLTANHSVTSAFLNNTYYYPLLLSGLKDGEWSIYSPEYNNDEYKGNVLAHPRGPETDPDNPKYVYFGSWYSGMYRINLEDPKDILHMTHPYDRGAKLSGYKYLIADNAYKELCHFSAPRFDSKGNLWALHTNYNGADSGTSNIYDGVIWVWPAADRKAGNVGGWIRTGITGFTVDKDALIKPLKSEANKNLVIVSNGRSMIFVIDTKGTPTDFSDDVSVQLGSIYDQDGSNVVKNMVYDFHEDMSTGTVWVATSTGIFTFNPRTIFANPTSVRRIKVSRNDGTNLADYLLDGIGVMRIVADNAGNKWFATSGAGLVETSSDGTHVIRQLLAENSYLPEDIIYDMGYNPATNSLMLSTKAAYAEYFPPGASSGNNFDAVKVYPNPVRPDYLGWITIEGLLDNSLVKIVDASGNLVKELGHSVGGKIQWDGTNLTNARVNSGMYYIMMSNTDTDAPVANVGKVLVVK